MEHTNGHSQNIPRLVVEYDNSNGAESFKCGVTGMMPTLQLIGAVVRVQSELARGVIREHPDCDKASWKGLVILWEKKEKEFVWFCHPDLSNAVDNLIGTLEMAKVSLIGMQMAQQNAGIRIPPILGVDGRPIM